MRLAPVMLALLLVLSPGAVAMQASTPTPASADRVDTVGPAVNENTTAVLVLGTDPDRTAFNSPSVSLASSLEADRGEFRSELSTKTLEKQLRDADSDEAKKRILNRYRYRIENRIISLEAEERRATRAFSNGTISANEYVRTLGRLQAETTKVHQRINAMRNSADQIPNFALKNEAEGLRTKLVPLEGPVRDRIEKTLRGDTRSERIYVSTTDSGVVLSTVTGDVYVREIVRTDHRDSSGSGSLTLRQASDLVFENYPWAEMNVDGGVSTTPYGTTNVYSVSLGHTHGNITAYVDGGTEKIFKEVQYKRLSGQQSLPPGPGVQNSTNVFGAESVTLTVNRTHAGGPLRVQLTNATGEPLDGTITVDGEPVGETGEDGILWTLSPDEEFRVSGIYAGTTVNVTTVPTVLEQNSSEG